MIAFAKITHEIVPESKFINWHNQQGFGTHIIFQNDLPKKTERCEYDKKCNYLKCTEIVQLFSQMHWNRAIILY